MVNIKFIVLVNDSAAMYALCTIYWDTNDKDQTIEHYGAGDTSETDMLLFWSIYPKKIKNSVKVSVK